MATIKEVSDIRVNGKSWEKCNGKKLNSLTINDTKYLLVRNVYLYIALDNDELSELEFNLKKGTEVTVNSVNGYISFNNETYSCGSKTGYDFDYWTINGEVISTTRTFVLTSETIILANWVEKSTPSVAYDVIVTISGFDIDANYNRKDLSSSETFSGNFGTTYNYTIGAILNQSSFTNHIEGLSIYGITTLSGASGLSRWYNGVSASAGSSTPPSTIYSTSSNLSLTISGNETISYYYVYNYKGYYFV